MLGGLLIAFLSAAAYGVATILQALGVRDLASVGPGAAWTRRAWAGRLYAVGLALDGLGFLATVVALRTLPLFLVESVVASSVAITAVLAVLVLGVRLAAREWGALAVVALGLVALALGAAEGPAPVLGIRAQWWVLALCAPALLVGVLAYADRDRSRSAVGLALASGLGYAVVGIGARILDTGGAWWHVLGRPALWAIAVGGGAAIVAYGFALDRGRTTSVTAVTFSVETVVPSLAGLLWLGDRVRPGLGWLAAAGFVLTLGGCVVLAGRAEPEVDTAGG